MIIGLFFFFFFMELTEIRYKTFATLINTYRIENLRKLEIDVIIEKNYELQKKTYHLALSLVNLKK